MRSTKKKKQKNLAPSRPTTSTQTSGNQSRENIESKGQPGPLLAFKKLDFTLKVAIAKMSDLASFERFAKEVSKVLADLIKETETQSIASILSYLIAEPVNIYELQNNIKIMTDSFVRHREMITDIIAAQLSLIKEWERYLTLTLEKLKEHGKLVSSGKTDNLSYLCSIAKLKQFTDVWMYLLADINFYFAITSLQVNFPEGVKQSLEKTKTIIEKYRTLHPHSIPWKKLRIKFEENYSDALFNLACITGNQEYVCQQMERLHHKSESETCTVEDKQFIIETICGYYQRLGLFFDGKKKFSEAIYWLELSQEYTEQLITLYKKHSNDVSKINYLQNLYESISEKIVHSQQLLMCENYVLIEKKFQALAIPFLSDCILRVKRKEVSGNITIKLFNSKEVEIFRTALSANTINIEVNDNIFHLNVLTIGHKRLQKALKKFTEDILSYQRGPAPSDNIDSLNDKIAANDKEEKLARHQKNQALKQASNRQDIKTSDDQPSTSGSNMPDPSPQKLIKWAPPLSTDCKIIANTSGRHDQQQVFSFFKKGIFKDVDKLIAKKFKHVASVGRIMRKETAGKQCIVYMDYDEKSSSNTKNGWNWKLKIQGFGAGSRARGRVVATGMLFSASPDKSETSEKTKPTRDAILIEWQALSRKHI